VAGDDDAGSQGLRERKKLRTRSTLIDVAAELCLRQGYDNTTVEQIAAAADVSPRTFSRYFPSKESVIAAIADDMDQWVAEALAKQPFDITEHEALLRAHLLIFSPDGPYAPTAFNRMAVLIQIVNASPALSGAAFGFRQGHANSSVEVIAARMETGSDDPAVRLVADVWTTLFASAFSGMGTPGNPPIRADILCERLTSTFDVFSRTCSPWREDRGYGVR
jgi:AcrR family transcriptional regulator